MEIFVINSLKFFFSSKIQMIIYRRGWRSDTRSDSYRVFRMFQVFEYKGIDSARVFSTLLVGFEYFMSGSDILGRVRIFKF